VGHQAREDHARQSGHEHARNVPSPLGKSVVVIAVNGVEAKALVKDFGFDVVADGVSHGDTAH
jgi:ribosomal protein L25 (general stress protein Ctc)